MGNTRQVKLHRFNMICVMKLDFGDKAQYVRAQLHKISHHATGNLIHMLEL